MNEIVTPLKGIPLMGAFAFMADVLSGSYIKTKKKSDEQAEESLKNLLNAGYLPEWDLAFVPALFSDKNLARNTTTMFYNSTSHHLVIGVAGTNFVDYYDWYSEDVNVTTLVPWNKDIIKNGKENKATGSLPAVGYVSQGTANAVYQTWKNTNHHGIWHKKLNQTPIQWLNENLKKLGVAKISVTGHSLGGAIAPAFAAALCDNLGDLISNKPGGGKIPIDVFTFAGPTPGDENFRSHVEDSSMIEVTCTNNNFDVVPHAWELDALKELHLLYSNPKNPVAERPLEEATSENIGSIVYYTIESIIAASKEASKKNHPYTRWKNEDANDFTPEVFLPKGFDLKGTASGLADKLLSNMSQETIQKLVDITGVQPTSNVVINMGKLNPLHYIDNLEPYMTYFCEFLTLLGLQHTVAYHNKLFGLSGFGLALSKIYDHAMKPTNVNEQLAELAIIDQLISLVHTYFESNTFQKEGNLN